MHKKEKNIVVRNAEILGTGACLALRTDRLQLFDAAAKAGANTGCHNNKTGFHFHLVPPDV
jgi:hypothetical protein